jgi:hypothetical protein
MSHAVGSERWIEKWQQFHAANPDVYKLFSKFAHHAIKKGHEHLSPQMIFERIRWETNVETVSDDGFKVNDAFAPFYSRLFSEEFPEHKDFFRKRKSGADKLFTDGGKTNG